MPDCFSISPSIAETKDDFPDPTVPTMAVSEPFLTVILISSKTVGSSLDHLKIEGENTSISSSPSFI